MVVTFETPVGGLPFAVGFLVQPKSDTLATIPPDAFWVLELTHLEDPSIHIGDSGSAQPTATPSAWIFGQMPDGRILVPFPKQQVVIGENVRLYAELRSSTTGTIDSGTVAVEWHPELATQYIAQTNETATAGGLTEEQATQLTTVTQMSMLPIGGPLLGQAAAALVGLGPRLLTRELITPDRSGEGRLTRPGGPFNVDAFGLAWQIIAWPPGIGIDEGAPDAFEIDVLQLAKISRLNDGAEVVAAQLTAKISDSMWLWQFDTPWAVDYYIVPGLTVRFWWIRVAISPPA